MVITFFEKVHQMRSKLGNLSQENTVYIYKKCFVFRMLLQKFPVTGETQERERILLQFSKRYHECNGQLYGSEGMETFVKLLFN